jgi:hypothetical protein
MATSEIVWYVRALSRKDQEEDLRANQSSLRCEAYRVSIVFRVQGRTCRHRLASCPNRVRRRGPAECCQQSRGTQRGRESFEAAHCMIYTSGLTRIPSFVCLEPSKSPRMSAVSATAQDSDFPAKRKEGRTCENCMCISDLASRL